MLFAFLISWAATTAQTAAQPAPNTGPPSASSPQPEEPGPVETRQTAHDQLSTDDEELIKNLDLIENLDLLDAAEALGAVNTPDTPEEEF
jgi:hypothetical protein